MTTNPQSVHVRALALCALLLALATPAAAQEQRGFAKVGGFVGGTFMPGFTFDGETFDGQTVYREEDGEELGFLPKIDKKPLFRGILGYRGPNLSLEVGYERSQHGGAFLDVPLDSTFQSVNVDARYFFAIDHRIQPHVLIGGAFPWFTVEDGSYLDPDVGDATWRGYGLNTGVGVTVFPTRQFGISVGYTHRFIWFDRATGVSDTLFELRPRFRERSGALSINTTYTF
jgi:hypothetical protein